MRGLITGLSVLAAANMAFAQAETTTAVGGKTTAKVEEVKAEKSKFGASFFTETNISQNAFRDGTVREDSITDIAVGLSYADSDTTKLNIKPWATMNQTDDTRTQEIEMNRIQLSRSNSQAFKVNNTDIGSDVRLYVPTAGYWTELGRWEARYGLSFDQVITPKLTLSHAGTLRGYAYTEENDGQQYMRYYLGSTASYKVNDIVSPYFGVTYEGRQYHTGTGLDSLSDFTSKSNPTNARDTIFLSLGADISAGPITIGAYTEQNYRFQRNNEFNLGESGEMDYYLQLSASL